MPGRIGTLTSIQRAGSSAIIGMVVLGRGSGAMLYGPGRRRIVTPVPEEVAGGRDGV